MTSNRTARKVHYSDGTVVTEQEHCINRYNRSINNLTERLASAAGEAQEAYDWNACTGRDDDLKAEIGRITELLAEAAKIAESIR